MTPSDIDKLEDELIRAKKDLEERLQKMKNHIQHVDTENDPDFEEQAVQNINDDVVNELSDTLKVQLSEINLALNRIDKGTYGICSSCGEEITSERLNAIPYTTLCKQCMTGLND